MKQFLISVLLFTMFAHAGYRYRYLVTVDHTQAGSSDSANFPILVYISSNADFATAANGGYIQNTVTLNGQAVPADLIVTTDAVCQTQVTAWEVASYSATAGTVELWVNQGTLSHSTNTLFYICIGNSAVTTYQSTATSTWNSAFLGVWHLTSLTACSGSTTCDSTANAHNGTNASATAVTSCAVGNCIHTTQAQYVTVTQVTSLSAFTISEWINGDGTPPTSSNHQAIWNNNDVFTFSWGHANAAFRQACYIQNSGGSYFAAKLTATLAASTWYYIACTWDGSNLNAYENGGASQATTAVSSLAALSSTLGFTRSTAGTDAFAGDSDEIRFSNTARSADWLTAEYNMEKPSQTMVTLGSRFALSGPRGVQVVDVQRPTSGLHTSGASVR